MDLKPCPFCGHEAWEKARENPDGRLCTVCTTCEAQGPTAGTNEWRRSLWNTRPSGWISVEDRLPDASQEDVDVIMYDTTEGALGGQYMGIDAYAEWVPDAELARVRNVTHWMPLPEDPQ